MRTSFILGSYRVGSARTTTEFIASAFGVQRRGSQMAHAFMFAHAQTPIKRARVHTRMYRLHTVLFIPEHCVTNVPLAGKSNRFGPADQCVSRRRCSQRSCRCAETLPEEQGGGMSARARIRVCSLDVVRGEKGGQSSKESETDNSISSAAGALLTDAACGCRVSKKQHVQSASTHKTPSQTQPRT